MEEFNSIIEKIIPNRGNSPELLDTLGRAAKIGLPSRKKEDWKFFPIDQYLKKWDPRATTIPSKIAKKVEWIESEKEYCLTLPYGFTNLEKFEPIKGLKIYSSSNQHWKPLINKYQQESFFPLINMAGAPLKLELELGKNSRIEKPLRIKWVGTEGISTQALCPSVNIHCSGGSELQIIIDHSGIPSGALVNSLLRAELEEGALFEINQEQAFSNSTIFISNQIVFQQADSVFRSNSFSFSGGMLRNNLHNSLLGKGAESIMNGLFTPIQNNNIDNHTIVDHVSPGCHSNENYKGIIFDKGTGVFNGKIFVRPDAQKTLAFQSNKNILLGKNPTIHTKPQLEIWADDVKCTHGATTGRLDQEQLFYLKSRGIGQEEAERMLTMAFAQEIVDKIRIPHFREQVSNSLFKIFQAVDD